MSRAASLFAIAAALAVLAAGLPAADAHGGHASFAQMKITPDKTRYVTLEIPDAPFPIAGMLHTVNFVLMNASGNRPVTDETVHVVLTSPTNQTQEHTLAPEDVMLGAYVARLVFDEQGAWRGNVTVLPANQSVELEFLVYGPSPYVVNSLNAETSVGDTYVTGRLASVPLEVTHVETGAPAPAASDATALVERWTDDHKTLLDAREVPLEDGGPGMLYLNTTFELDGMYHVFVASPTLGLAYEDRPYVHVYAVNETRARELGMDLDDAETPAPGAAWLLGVAGLAAAARRLRGRHG